MLHKVFILWCIIESFILDVTESAGLWRQETMLGSPHLVYYPEEEPRAEPEDYPEENLEPPQYHSMDYAEEGHHDDYQRIPKNIWDRHNWNPHAFKTIPDFQYFFHGKERNHVEGRGYRQPRIEDLQLLHDRRKRNTPTTTKSTKRQILWTYDQKGGVVQDDWKNVFEICDGDMQSPINIELQQLMPIFVDDVKFGHGYFSHDGHNLDFYNSGNGLSIDLVDPDHEVTLSEGPFNYTYSLHTIQFFYRSLHTVEDEQYPMEILFVHTIKGVAIEDALNMPNGVLIMSVMVQGIHSNPQIDKERRQAVQTLLSFTSHSSIIGKPGARVRSRKVSASLISLIPLVPHQFYLYQGSLPYPPCTEGIIWMVNRPILYIPIDALRTVLYNLKQMRDFLTLPVRRNNRRTQRVNDRVMFLLLIGLRPDKDFEKFGRLVFPDP